jgi:hypothetical protein
MSVVDSSFDHPLQLEEQASAPLAGGMLQSGYQCGMLWGATLAAGAQAYWLLGPGSQAETLAVMAAHRLVEAFRTRTNHKIDCREIIGLDFKRKNQFLPVLKFFIKGGPIGCFHLAAQYAPLAFSEINCALSEKQVETPAAPVSCAAMLAQKMGAFELHTVMAAGFAGGIGLSGGGCGALGAAIWIIGMNSGKQGAGMTGFNNPTAIHAIERFLESSGNEFECSKIARRRFEDIDEHAGYLRAGGCTEIIEALAAS